jgi:hypothetical protein
MRNNHLLIRFKLWELAMSTSDECVNSVYICVSETGEDKCGAPAPNHCLYRLALLLGGCCCD